jgi:MYXO-CTERM domain-containing protein
MTRRLLALGAFALPLLAGIRAAQADVTAVPCDKDPHYCGTGPIAFDRSDSLPVEWAFDTGWTPQGSPLQVHLWAGVYATTRVSLKGALETSWPEALVLRTPGAPDGGLVAFHYGVELGAQAAVHITVAGQNYDWVGDIPYVPQIDFQVQGEQGFDAWGFDPGATVSSKTQPQTIIQVGIGDIIGGSIPGIDGGLEVDVAMELAATYRTKRMVIRTDEGEPVAGGDITSQNGETTTKYQNGPAVDLDVHPEGTVDYDGTIHLIPAFWVELLGKNWSIPIADIPIAFPITQTKWVFDAQRVHVPLPDLVVDKVEIDFGEVEVGQKKLETFSAWNAGEALAKIAVVSSNPDVFPAWDPSLDVEPGITADSAVRFMPTKNGPFVATLFVASNDPSDPVQEIVLKGVGFGGPDGFASDISQEGSCACRTAPSDPSSPSPAAPALAMFGAVAVAFFRRRQHVGQS